MLLNPSFLAKFVFLTAIFLIKIAADISIARATNSTNDNIDEEAFRYTNVEPRIGACSVADAAVLANAFKGPNPLWWDYSNCPTDTWMEGISLCDHRSPKVFVNVGVNKV